MAKRPPPGIPYRGDAPKKRAAPIKDKTPADIDQQVAEIQARIDNRLFEAMWPSRKSAVVINCDDYDPLGE